VRYTHDVRVLAQIDNFVAINSVLAVDLTGQANAEMLGGRQVSGTGGLLDFVRGARLSQGGRSILALPSTAGGRTSRIVPSLGETDVVSCPRADADVVVTEHGIAHLRAKSIDERAEALSQSPTRRFAAISPSGGGGAAPGSRHVSPKGSSWSRRRR
jgi:4-hydroxybutyrate CoA-transferase